MLNPNNHGLNLLNFLTKPVILLYSFAGQSIFLRLGYHVRQFN